MGDDTGQFQMDAAVQAGNSGGPIYDVREFIRYFDQHPDALRDMVAAIEILPARELSDDHRKNLCAPAAGSNVAYWQRLLLTSSINVRCWGRSRHLWHQINVAIFMPVVRGRADQNLSRDLLLNVTQNGHCRCRISPSHSPCQD